MKRNPIMMALMILIGWIPSMPLIQAQSSPQLMASYRTFQSGGQSVLPTDVMQAVFSSDGKTLFTIGQVDQVARLRSWNTADGQLLRLYDMALPLAADSNQQTFALTPDGRALLVGTTLWDVQSGQKLLSQDQAQGAILATDGLAILFWQMRSDQCIAVWQNITSQVNTPSFSLGKVCPLLLAASPDGQQLATVESDHQTSRFGISLRDSHTGSVVRNFVEANSETQLTNLSWSADGQLLLAGGVTTFLWEFETGKLRLSFNPPYAGDVLPTAAFSSDGKTVISAGTQVDIYPTDGTVQPLKTMTTLRPDGRPGYEHIVPSPDGNTILLVKADPDNAMNQAEVWDLASAQPRYLLHEMQLGHIDSLYDAAFSPDGKFVLTAGMDGIARLWNAASAKLIREFIGHKDRITHVAYAPNGKTILTASYDLTAQVWDVQTGKEIRVLEPEDGLTYPISSMTYAPDSTHIAAGTGDGRLLIWDLKREQPQSYQFDSLSPISTLVYSHDGRSIYMAQSGSGGQVLNAESGAVLRMLETNDAFAVSPDEKLIFAAKLNDISNENAFLLDAHTGKRIRTLETGAWPVGYGPARAFSPNGKSVVSAGQTLNGRSDPVMWDVQTGHILRVFHGQNNVIMNVVFSPDGTQLLTAGLDGTARLWDVQTGQEIRRFSTHSNYVYSGAWSPDGQTVLIAGMDNILRLAEVGPNDRNSDWLRAQMATARQFVGHTAPILSVAYSHNGQTVLSGSADNTARLWDARTGKVLHVFAGRSDAIRSVVYSPDDQWVVTGSEDGTVRVWDAKTGQSTRQYDGSSVVWQVAYSNDGKYIAAASDDGLVRIWNAQTGQLTHTLLGHIGPALSVAFAPDSQTLLTGGADGKEYQWEVATGWRIFEDSTGQPPASDPVWNFTFTPDGTSHVTGLLGIQQWGGGSPYVRPYTSWVALSPDGKYLMMLDRSGAINLMPKDW